MDGVEDIIYGSIAGIAGKIIEYPFDTVKVRLQSQPDHLPLRYTGPIDCFRQSIRADGIINGLYRGVTAPLVGAALETSSLFFWENMAQKSFYYSGLYARDTPLPLSALWATGAISGAFTSLILTPIELVKCKIQVPTVATSDGMVRIAPTYLSVIQQVFRHQGLMGFWNGQMGTLIRETGGCAAWFGSKETVTQLFKKWNKDTSQDPIPLPQQAVAGAAAGVSYNFLFYPADTVKSRLQTMSVEGAKLPSFWSEGLVLWRQHGLKGMYRGCGITVLRSAPSSAFIFIVFDALKRNVHLSEGKVETL